jgi:streptomycin 6-kinase
MFELPEVVRNYALRRGAHRWIDELPALIVTLEREWSIRVGRAYSGGTEAFVADATLLDGTPAVVKLIVPAHDTAARNEISTTAARNEITTLELANGVGCARLLGCDAERGALLVERLGRSLYELGLPLQTRHAILCDTGALLWRPAPGCDLPTGAEKGRWLINTIATMWEELDRPCSQRAVDHAMACAERRISVHDDERAVLVHGDLHQWNTLQAADGFKLIDPDGLLAEAEYDLGIIMREDPLELLTGDPRERARWLAKRSGLDATAIWEWGVVERVSTGMLGLQVGLHAEGRQMLAAAELVATLV